MVVCFQFVSLGDSQEPNASLLTMRSGVFSSIRWGCLWLVRLLALSSVLSLSTGFQVIVESLFVRLWRQSLGLVCQLGPPLFQVKGLDLEGGYGIISLVGGWGQDVALWAAG